jgi:hypothetical protein
MPSSLRTIFTYTLEASHLGAPVSVLGTVVYDIYIVFFHGHKASSKRLRAIPSIRLVLIVTILPSLVLVSTEENP